MEELKEIEGLLEQGCSEVEEKGVKKVSTTFMDSCVSTFEIKSPKFAC